MPKTRQRRRKTKQTKKRGGYKSDEKIIEQLKQEYVKKIMSKIRYYYKKQLMFNFVERNEVMPQTIIPSMFRTDSIENKQKISFEELKNKLKNNCAWTCIKINIKSPDSFFSKIATAYINSKNVRDFLNNNEMKLIREEYFKFIENELLEEIIIKPENITSHQKKILEEYDLFLNGTLAITIDYHKQIGKRYFHIKLRFNAQIYNILSASSRMMYPQNYINSCNLFDVYGFKNYEIDDKTKLLSVLNTTASEVLDADTLSQIRDFT